MQSTSIPRISAVKIDVEGHENSVLSGAVLQDLFACPIELAGQLGISAEDGLAV